MRISIKNAIRPIKTEKDYRRSLRIIETLMDAKKGSLEANILNVLAIFVEKYEEEHYPIPAPDPIEAIKFRMDQLGLTQNDIAKMIGKSRASELLRRKRRLTIDMMRTFRDKWGIPADSLLGA
jgi:HTH-type transcriptional regulator/antitoxin HigA